MECLKILSQKNNSTVRLIRIDKQEWITKYYQQPTRSMLIELNILATCRHPNIISLIKLYSSNPISPIMMFMKNLEYNLQDLLQYHLPYPYLTKLKYLLQISSGLQYLHHHQIVHMDLKPNNIMISNDNCQIIDFGNSEYCLGTQIIITQSKCTPTHRPPEAFYHHKLDFSFDIWSFGIIMFEILKWIPIHLHPIIPRYCSRINQDQYQKDMYQFILSNQFEEIRGTLPPALQSLLSIKSDDRLKIKNIKKYLEKLFVSDVNGIVGRTIERTFEINTNHSQIKSQIILYSTNDLIHRLKKYHLNIPIRTLHQITSQYYDDSTVLDIDIKVLNQIIKLTNGVLFRFHYYLYNLDPILQINQMLRTDQYLEKSDKLFDLIQNN